MSERDWLVPVVWEEEALTGDLIARGTPEGVRLAARGFQDNMAVEFQTPEVMIFLSIEDCTYDDHEAAAREIGSILIWSYLRSKRVGHGQERHETFIDEEMKLNRWVIEPSDV